MMKGLLSGLALIVLASYTSQEVWQRDPEPDALNFLGEADGRSFYYERTIERDWDEAKSFCNSSGMHVASLDAKNQLDLVMNSTSVDFAGTCYWTSGHDTMDFTRFKWNDTLAVVNLTGYNYTYGLAPLRVAVLFCKESSPYFIAKEVATKSSTLCESS